MSEYCSNEEGAGVEGANGVSGSNANFQVAIRVRPLNERESRSGRASGWLVQSDSGQIQQTLTVDGRPINGPSFSFGMSEMLKNVSIIYCY